MTRNLVNRNAENFKPPVFKPNSSARNRVENWMRRFLDLQAGSLWRDLSIELARAPGVVLDVGCGAQVYRCLLPAQSVYLGIDTSDAESRFGYKMPDTHYFDGAGWGVEAGAFDTVLCTEVLEHVQDPAAFLDQAHACLRPEGRLILTVPFAARWHFIPHDYWRFTPAGLALLLNRAGFSDVHVKARGNPLTVACYKVMTLYFMLLFGTGVIKRITGVLLLPILGVLTCIANLSLLTDWGDDCLGYTVTARR
jgi:SAM-dependent methyltransferase